MALEGGRRPEIFHSDQGCQFTSGDFDAPPLCRSRPCESWWVWSCGNSLLSCLQGRTPLEGRVRPERVVLPTPTIGQDLRLRSCGKELGVEELISEPAIERFCDSVLPVGSRRDLGRASGGGAGLTPYP
jgi:hypothetical protein